MIHVGWPQGIWMGLVVLRLVLVMIVNGKPKTGHYDLATDMLSVVLAFGLLYWGGFFRQ